jgi:serine/threonine-protein kinase
MQAGDIITLSKGNYSLHAPMAGSAYGIIWRAAAPEGGPDVALKLINRAQMERTDSALQARWIASANTEIEFLVTLAAWDERHIVRLLDSGLHDGLPVMALELLETDLARHMAACQPAPLQILGWIAQINQALAKVHQAGWLYLDLKPANVLLTRHGAVKLADFGTNRLRSALPADAYAGTASWQAPEQFFPDPQQRYDTDQRSDYFALGAMFYFLVTGAPLRFCADCGEAYRRHQLHAPATLLSLRAGAIGPTLQEQEAALFLQRFAGADPDATWCPEAGNAAADAALGLLRALLAADRARRPQHALQISRMIAVISARMRSTAPAPHPLRPIAAVSHPAWGRA